MATPPEFERPGTSEGFSPSKHPEWIGKLCIMRPHFVQYITFKPEEGPKKVVNTYVVFLDLQGPPDGRPVVIDGANISSASLVPQLHNKLGRLVLGRLIQSPPQPGKSPSYQLDPNYTDQDAQLAGQYIQRFPLPPVPDAPPVEPAPAPPAAPWQGAPEQPAAQPPGQWGQAPVAQPYAAAQPAQQWGQQPQAPAGQQQFQAPPADVWAGTNAAPAQPAQWQGQGPAQAAPAQQWGQTPQQPAAQPQAPAQQWQQPQPAVAQDPALVARVQAMGLQVTPDMDNNVLMMIANGPQQ